MNSLSLPSSLARPSDFNHPSKETFGSKTDKTHLIQKNSLKNSSETNQEGIQKNDYFDRKNAITIGAAGCALGAVIRSNGCD